MQERPFHQLEYKPAEIKLLEYKPAEIKLADVVGFAYKFTLFIPITEDGESIFSEEKEEELRKLFDMDFGGCTYTENVTHPLLAGEWIEPETKKRVFNEHTRYEVYARQSHQSQEYFQELQVHLREYFTIPQQKILIEMISVKLL